MATVQVVDQERTLLDCNMKFLPLFVAIFAILVTVISVRAKPSPVTEESDASVADDVKRKFFGSNIFGGSDTSNKKKKIVVVVDGSDEDSSIKRPSKRPIIINNSDQYSHERPVQVLQPVFIDKPNRRRPSRPQYSDEWDSEEYGHKKKYKKKNKHPELYHFLNAGPYQPQYQPYPNVYPQPYPYPPYSPYQQHHQYPTWPQLPVIPGFPGGGFNGKNDLSIF